MSAGIAAILAGAQATVGTYFAANKRSGVGFVTSPPDLSDNEVYPFFDLHEYRYRVGPVGNARGQTPDKPTFYCAEYVAQRYSVQNRRRADVYADLRGDHDLFYACFDVEDNRSLGPDPAGVANGLVKVAGMYMDTEFDQQGPYIRYYEDLVLGFRIVFSVVEHIRSRL